MKFEETNNYKGSDFSTGFADTQKTKFAAFGLGGAGNNCIEHMYSNKSLKGLDFYAANTDAQALNRMRCNKIALGKKLTKGLGSGGDPNIGREAALEAREELEDIIKGYDCIFIVLGAGGGTGSGSFGVVADIARNLNVLTIASVSKPFFMEGPVRNRIATQAIQENKSVCDLTIVTANDNLKKTYDSDATFIESLKECNNVICNSLETVFSIVNTSGFINVDYNDVARIVRQSGLGLISSAIGRGELRAKSATLEALHSPLLDDIDLSTAKGALVNVVSGLDLKLSEYEAIGQVVSDNISSDDANFIMGNTIDPDMREGEIKVSVLLAGTDSYDKKSDTRTSSKDGSSQTTKNPFASLIDG